MDDLRVDSGCAGKESYPSENAAEAVLAVIRKGGRRVWSGCWLGTYYCTFCCFWHIGHDNVKTDIARKHRRKRRRKMAA